MSSLFKTLERTRGLVVPMVTWLDDRGTIDLDAMAKHAAHLVANGCNGIFVLGTTGEFPYLSHADKRAIMSGMVESVKGKVPVLAGISAPGTRESIELGKMAIEAGVDAAVAVLPQYLPLGPGDVQRYFESVAGGLAREGGIPLFLYHIPLVPAAAHAITPELVFALAKAGHINGVKATIFDASFFSGLRAMLDKDYTVQCNVWTGTDPVTLKCLQDGIKIDGTIVGSLNLFPAYYKALFKAYGETPRDASRCAVLDKVNAMVADLFAIELKHVPAMVKEALHAAKLPFARCTAVLPPLPPATDAVKSRTAGLMAQLAAKGISP